MGRNPWPKEEMVWPVYGWVSCKSLKRFGLRNLCALRSTEDPLSISGGIY